MWPFTKKISAEQKKHSAALDELIARVKPDIEAHGGFVIIGLKGEKDHRELNMGAMIRDVKKSQVIFAVTKSLSMNEIQVLLSMAQYEQSKVMYPSPLSDLFKKKS